MPITKIKRKNIFDSIPLRMIIIMMTVTTIPIFGTLAVFWVLGIISRDPAPEPCQAGIITPILQVLKKKLREMKRLDPNCILLSNGASIQIQHRQCQSPCSELGNFRLAIFILNLP